MGPRSSTSRIAIVPLALAMAVTSLAAPAGAGVVPDLDEVLAGCHPDTFDNPVRITSVTLTLVAGSGDPVSGFVDGDRVEVRLWLENQVHPLCGPLQQRPTNNVRARITYEADPAVVDADMGERCDLSEAGSSCSLLRDVIEVDVPGAGDQHLVLRAGQQGAAGFDELDVVELDVPIA